MQRYRKCASRDSRPLELETPLDDGALYPHQMVQLPSPTIAYPRHAASHIIRDIAGQLVLERAFGRPLTRTGKIRSQQQRQLDWNLHSLALRR